MYLGPFGGAHCEHVIVCLTSCIPKEPAADSLCQPFLMAITFVAGRFSLLRVQYRQH